MIAFVETWVVAPSELDRVLSMAPRIVEGVQQQHGFQGFHAYVNRADNTLLTISQWATPEDLAADRAHHDQVVASIASLATVSQERTYEVVVNVNS